MITENKGRPDNPLRGFPGVEDVLRQGAVWADPPEDLERRVLAATTGNRVAVLFAPRRRRVGVLLAAAAVFVLVAGFLFTRDGSGAAQVELAGTPLAARAHAVVELADTPSGAELRLDVTGLAPAPPGSYYEGWVTGRRGWVSIGTFHLRRGTDDVVLWSGVSLEDYPRVVVTVQAEGGGAKSSGRVVLQGDVPPRLR